MNIFKLLLDKVAEWNKSDNFFKVFCSILFYIIFILIIVGGLISIGMVCLWSVNTYPITIIFYLSIGLIIITYFIRGENVKRKLQKRKNIK